LQRALGDVTTLGLVAADLLTSKDGFQQLGPGAVAIVALVVCKGPLLQLPRSQANGRLPANKPTRSDDSSGFLDPSCSSEK
jgi:hypothetical protein